MSQTTSEGAPDLTTAQLTELARIASGDDRLRLKAWRVETVHGGFGGAIGGTALFRIFLQPDPGQAFSLILKILYERAGENPQSPYYWKREYELYRAGILDMLPDDTFLPPRVIQTQDFGDSCWVWMADYTDGKRDWTLDDYAEIARRLGRMNGGLLGRELPRHDWLARNWHSAIAPALADAFDALPQSLENPLARITLPIEVRDEILAIWRDRRLFQDALLPLPQTLCHNDAFRRNILHSAQGPVLLDWALAGTGAIGEELVSLAAVSLYYSGFTQAYAEALDRQIFAGYIAGLREAGWRGAERLARIGYTCGMTLRGLAGVKQDINYLLDADEHQQLKTVHEIDSVEQIAAMFAEVRRFRLLTMAREARQLLSG